MTFLNRWLKRKPNEIDDPDQLRETLFAAVSSQDWDGFALLCQAEREAIFSNFLIWKDLLAVCRLCKPSWEAGRQPALYRDPMSLLFRRLLRPGFYTPGRKPPLLRDFEDIGS